LHAGEVELVNYVDKTF